MFLYFGFYVFRLKSRAPRATVTSNRRDINRGGLKPRMYRRIHLHRLPKKFSQNVGKYIYIYHFHGTAYMGNI